MTEDTTTTPPAGATGGVREAVRTWRARDPDITASQLARALGVTRGRIRQILVDLGLPTSTTRSPGAKPKPSLETALRMLAVLREMDAQIRAESYCATCQLPTHGLQWDTYEDGHARQQTLAEAGLCSCGR